MYTRSARAQLTSSVSDAAPKLRSSRPSFAPAVDASALGSAQNAFTAAIGRQAGIVGHASAQRRSVGERAPGDAVGLAADEDDADTFRLPVEVVRELSTLQDEVSNRLTVIELTAALSEGALAGSVGELDTRDVDLGRISHAIKVSERGMGERSEPPKPSEASVLEAAAGN